MIPRLRRKVDPEIRRGIGVGDPPGLGFVRSSLLTIWRSHPRWFRPGESTLLAQLSRPPRDQHVGVRQVPRLDEPLGVGVGERERRPHPVLREELLELHAGAQPPVGRELPRTEALLQRVEVRIDARIVERHGAEVGQLELRVEPVRPSRRVVHRRQAQLVEPDLATRGVPSSPSREDSSRRWQDRRSASATDSPAPGSTAPGGPPWTGMGVRDLGCRIAPLLDRRQVGELDDHIVQGVPPGVDGRTVFVVVQAVQPEPEDRPPHRSCSHRYTRTSIAVNEHLHRPVVEEVERLVRVELHRLPRLAVGQPVAGSESSDCSFASTSSSGWVLSRSRITPGGLRSRVVLDADHAHREGGVTGSLAFLITFCHWFPTRLKSAMRTAMVSVALTNEHADELDVLQRRRTRRCGHSRGSECGTGTIPCCPLRRCGDCASAPCRARVRTRSTSSPGHTCRWSSDPPCPECVRPGRPCSLPSR